MKYLFLSVLIASLVGVMTPIGSSAYSSAGGFPPNVFGEYVPDWVKNTAGWWADDKISVTEFVNAIEFLVKENIIQVNVSQTSGTSQGVPDWIKNNAGWWADGQIDDNSFVSGIQYLVKVGIIKVS